MAQEPQSDIQTGALWRLRATCVADLFLRDVESADSQDPGRGLMGTGYFVQAVGGYCTTSPNNLFVLLVPASPDSRTDPCPLLALHTTFFKLCVPPEKPPPGGAALSLSGHYGHLGVVIPIVFFKTLCL